MENNSKLNKTLIFFTFIFVVWVALINIIFSN